MIAWAILILFVIFAGLMYTRRVPAILALPSMAVVIALVGAHGHMLAAVSTVFTRGPIVLAGAMSNTIFGAMLAYVVDRCGIAEAIVQRVTERAGRRAIAVATLMLIATALAFVALGGLGAVIMVGTLVLPIMTAAGIRPLAGASIFLFGISIGGLMNVGGWGLYRDVFHASVHTILVFSIVNLACLTLAAIAYIVIHCRRFAANEELGGHEVATDDPQKRTLNIPVPALATPLLPILLLVTLTIVDSELGTNYSATSINVALVISTVYGVLSTRQRETVSIMTKSMTEGIAAVAPVLGLMVGIGMVVTALMSPAVTISIAPIISRALPHSIFGYVAFFSLLSPLALYRGPFNLYGLGGGIAAILATAYSPALAMGALMATGLVQGVCDPTNTMNVWAGGFTKVDVNDILKSTLPYTMAATALALAIMGIIHA